MRYTFSFVLSARSALLLGRRGSPDIHRFYCTALMVRPPGVGGGVRAAGGGVTGGGTDAGTTVNVTGTVTGEAPVPLSVMMP